MFIHLRPGLPAYPNAHSPPFLVHGHRYVYFFACVLGVEVEVESLIEMLPNVVMAIREKEYEHLDTMWADSAKDAVFPRVSE